MYSAADKTPVPALSQAVEALTQALHTATAAGQWEAVAVIARELGSVLRGA